MNSDNPEPGSQRFLSFLTRLLPTTLKGTSGSPAFSKDDIETLPTVQMEMVAGVINLAQQNARDIMIPRVDVHAADISVSLKNLVAMIQDAGHSRLPVFEETIDNVVGILYVKELLPLLSARPKKFTLKKFIHQPFFVPETMPLVDLMLEFKLRKLHMAVVVDEYGGMSGIVTLEDILEEIVGEINDEFDEEELPEIVKTGNNTWEVDSRMPLPEFSEKLGYELNTDDFDTIGGFVFDLFGRIPEQDETIRYEKLTFKIKAINGTVINRIQVTRSSRK